MALTPAARVEVIKEFCQLHAPELARELRDLNAYNGTGVSLETPRLDDVHSKVQQVVGTNSFSIARSFAMNGVLAAYLATLGE